jgi:hypothetical protein
VVAAIAALVVVAAVDGMVAVLMVADVVGG